MGDIVRTGQARKQSNSMSVITKIATKQESQVHTFMGHWTHSTAIKKTVNSLYIRIENMGRKMVKTKYPLNINCTISLDRLENSRNKFRKQKKQNFFVQDAETE